MAGPVPTYLSTQNTTQTNFTVPFGLLAVVNAAISAATVAGEFNTTVDCSLFTAEDVSNLRIYLDSQGYTVEFAKNSNDKSLLIDWGRFLDIPGTEVIVDQGTTPWIVSGSVTIAVAANGTITVVAVGTTTTLLLSTNSNRKGFSIFNNSGTLYILQGLGNASTSNFTIKLANQGFYSGDSYIGPISACYATGSGSVNVTELA